MEITSEGVKCITISAHESMFLSEYRKFCEKNVVVERHMGTQLAQVPNPMYRSPAGLINQGQPEVVMTMLVTAIVFYIEKSEKNKKEGK